MKNQYLNFLRLIVKILFIAFVCIRVRVFIYGLSFIDLNSRFWFENILDFVIMFAFWFFTKDLLAFDENNNNAENDNKKNYKRIFNKNKKSFNK